MIMMIFKELKLELRSKIRVKLQGTLATLEYSFF